MSARVLPKKNWILKSQITDYPIIKRFEKMAGIEFDWSKFRNRRKFKEYFCKLINK